MAIYGIATCAVAATELYAEIPGDLNGHLRDCDIGNRWLPLRISFPET